MKRQSLSLDSFNLVGAICSIIALLLTVSNKLGVANLVQITFGVLLGISVGGLIMAFVFEIYELYVKELSSFFTSCIYWLFCSVIVAVIALLSGRLGYWIMDLVIEHIALPILNE